LILNDWTLQLYFSLHVNYQWYSYTQPIAEVIRKASPGGMWSTPTSQMMHQQVTVTLMWLSKRHFSMYTPC